MTVTVLLFAAYADAFGRSSLELEVPERCSASDVLHRLRQLAAPAQLPPALLAINQTIASAGDLLDESDEIAVIPPVAGG